VNSTDQGEDCIHVLIAAIWAIEKTAMMIR
jgi:hypothetical protein